MAIAEVDLDYLAGLVDIAVNSGCLALTVGDIAIAFPPKTKGPAASAIGFSADTTDDEESDDEDATAEANRRIRLAQVAASDPMRAVKKPASLSLYHNPMLFAGGKPPSFKSQE